MDFIDQLKALSERIVKLREQIATEEATKNAFVMPFLQCLGYDVFNPTEVLPEYIADIGIKKGEKVDYAILKEGQPVIIVECKWQGEKLDAHNSQLFRYFHVSKARFAILTNGISYQFFTDLEEPNKMDSKPFLEFDLSNINELIVLELKRFHKSSFNVEEILGSASELKYCKAIRNILQDELNKPSDEFVRFFAKQIIPAGKTLTAKLLDQFVPLVKRSVNQLITDAINDRLKAALTKEEQIGITQNAQAEAIEELNTIIEKTKPLIETTEEEKEAFYIIRSLLREKVDSKRIHYKDTLSYFGILLDNNVRRPICRLYLNGKKKCIGLFDNLKDETKVPIDSLDDIYKYEQRLVSTIVNYETGALTKEVESVDEGLIVL